MPAMFHLRLSHGQFAAWLALATVTLVRAESPTVNAPPLSTETAQQELYPLEWLTRSPSWRIWEFDGLISGAGPDPMPLGRLAGFRSLWPEINVWSSAAPLLTADLGRLAPDAGNASGLRPEGDKHVAKSNTDLEWAALNSKLS